MKKLISVLVIIMILTFSIPVSAGNYMTLPNGQAIDVSNLTDNEILQAVKLAKKSAGIEGTDTVKQLIQGVNPKDLAEWRVLITGTIKDVCNDLSITVNEFVTTPVGAGIAALIVYKIAGKDVLSNAFQVVIMIPLWFVWTCMVFFLGWYFFANKNFYQKISYNDKGKKIKEGLIRAPRYNWESTTSKVEFAYFLIVSEIITTILTIAIVLI
jgi:hypothetical protein